MTWKEAIIKVFGDEGNKPMSKEEITEKIRERNYRTAEQFAAAKTPADTVAAAIYKKPEFDVVGKNLFKMKPDTFVQIASNNTAQKPKTKKGLNWKEAIIKVLQENGQPMSVNDILQQIIDKKYRTDDELAKAKTPKQTVYSQLFAHKNLFIKVENNKFTLKEPQKDKTISQTTTSEKPTHKEKTRIIKNYGLHWERNKVNWKGNQMFGKMNNSLINLSDQKGIYILYNNLSQVIYVGQSVKGDSSIFKRLAAHTKETKLKSWTKFSWFGFCEINGDRIISDFDEKINYEDVANVIEALLIEVLCAPKNDTKGNLWGELIEQLVF